MPRLRVICHMVASVDGRIATNGWPLTDEARRHYEEIHASYNPRADDMLWLRYRVAESAD